MLEENPCPWTRISLYLTGYTKGNYDWLIISLGIIRITSEITVIAAASCLMRRRAIANEFAGYSDRLADLLIPWSAPEPRMPCAIDQAARVMDWLQIHWTSWAHHE